MANNEQKLDFRIRLAQDVEAMMNMSHDRRRKFEQRWFDNNFFDDGYHFRYVSRTTGKVIDTSSRESLNFPMRAIPKASRQIRGIANLLVQPEYAPIVYPDKVTRAQYQTDDEYAQALQESKLTAQRVGQWLEETWKDLEMKEKMTQMVISAAKTSVAYIQVWPDPIKEKLTTSVYDGFDIYCLGNLDDLENSPFVIKSVPTTLQEIMANEFFEEDQKKKVTADNKYSDSKVKDSYERFTYGSGRKEDEANTVLLREAFSKVYINDESRIEISKISPYILKGKKDGDQVLRHTFVANGVWLRDEFLDMDKYPFVSFTFEPGPLWQTPLIERFIPSNKSLDIVVSRLERYTNTMNTGIWLKRKSENFEITNQSGGQVIEYDSVSPTQANLQSLPPSMFNYIGLLEKFIEEQGAATSALGQLPSGVKSGIAIESLKATEFANLKISSDQLKKTVKRIAERMIDNAAQFFINPQTVTLMEQGEPTFFDIIGERGAELMEDLEEPIGEDTAIIRGDMPFDIEIDTGMALTMEGKRNVMQQVATFMLELAAQGLMNPEAVKVVTMKFLDTFKFGATQEFMEALDVQGLQDQFDQSQIDQVKVAVAEVLKDTGVAGQEADQRNVDATKVGMMEAMQDMGGQ